MQSDNIIVQRSFTYTESRFAAHASFDFGNCRLCTVCYVDIFPRKLCVFIRLSLSAPDSTSSFMRLFTFSKIICEVSSIKATNQGPFQASRDGLGGHMSPGREERAGNNFNQTALPLV